ncbi:MAG: ABC transporter ATP-binding protein, partial [Vicinamibacteria bacterium]
MILEGDAARVDSGPTRGEIVLDVRELCVEVKHATGRTRRVIDGMSFEVRAGETLALMGESGAGKTMTALTLLGLLPRSARVVSGQALWKGADLLTQTQEGMRKLRGKEIGIVFQDPMTSMHPTMRIDEQLAEALLAHQPGLSPRFARSQMEDRLEGMGIPKSRLTHFAHSWEWSGGMRQRALIAMATANRPGLLIADEPTSSLDGTTQAQVLQLIRGIQRETGISVLLISHDAAVVSEVADRVVVVREGRIVETGTAQDVLLRAHKAYTATSVEAQVTSVDRGIGASLRVTTPSPEPTPSVVLCVENLQVTYRARGASRESVVVQAVDDVSFRLHQGETLAIVGESGCGKSTLARSLVGLEPSALGSVKVDGVDILRATPGERRAARRQIQIVFQDPYSSLNPRRRVADSIGEPLRIHGEFERFEGKRRIADLLERVGLTRSHGSRFPHELSGGERQRVAIARALVLHPRIVILDEPVSALDAPNRAGILRLLGELQASRGLALLLISHDMSAVRHLARRVGAMRAG